MKRTAFALALVITLFVGLLAGTTAQQPAAGTVAVDRDDIGGVVTGAKGPEAGVWVIAETTDLPTKFVKIVVTDDQGRYLLPDLPGANYDVWVRGYGLVDSPKVKSAPGKSLNLKAVPAPNARAAAQYYPAGYWLSLMKVPGANEFPGTGPDGNGINPAMKSQSEWIARSQSFGCTQCHALGSKGTREVPEALGHFNSGAEAWERRVQSGQAGAQMSAMLNQFGRKRVLQVFGDWTDRIAKARCHRRRRARRASNATSSSPSGTSPSPRSTSTTSSRATGAIRE